MNILTVSTGDEKLDVAYKNFQVHVSSFDKFAEFQNYFNKIVKTDDKERLNKWLLKVLFIEFRYGRTQSKHDFDILLERVSSKDKEVLENWLKDKLEKVGDKNV
jgi:hypothetical protein